MSTTHLIRAHEARSTKQNKVEKTKALKDPMEVYDRLEAIAKGGYAQLAKEDSAYFLKCFGLYDKGEDFMLRVRIPGGQLNAEQARRIGEVAQRYGRDYIDLSTRMQVVLRYIQIEDIYEVLRLLREVGLSTFQTGVDNTRNFVTDPLDGLAHDNILPTKPLIDAMEAAIIENPEWISTLPRKFNTAILGSLSNSCNIYGHDCAFVLAQRDGAFGYNVYLGAKVGVQAEDADLFVAPDEVVPFYTALLSLFRDYGYRDNRNKNRFHFLLKDVGMEAILAAVKARAKLLFSLGGVTLIQSRPLTQGADKVLLRDGTFAYRLVVPSGVFSGTDMILSAKTAEQYGSGHLRLSYDQNIYFVGIAPDRIVALESSELVTKYAAYQNPYFQDMIACAGTHTCSFGVIPNKPDAVAMAYFLNDAVPMTHATVRMNWSACPKGCGVHGIADIGFEGCKAKDDAGNRVDGVHLFLGGKITRGAREAITLHKALPITEAKYHVKYLLKPYANFRERNETFEAFESRFLNRHYSYQALAFYTRINYLMHDKLELNVMLELEKEPKTYRNEAYEIFHFGLHLFKLLTGEKRFEAVDGLDPVLTQPRTIRRDEITRVNPAVPPKLSEVIYLMTHQDRRQRAQVFSELLMLLKEV